MFNWFYVLFVDEESVEFWTHKQLSKVLAYLCVS